MDRIESYRLFFSNLIAATAGIPPQNQRLRSALATVPREHFLGPGPWKIFTGGGYIETLTDDPAFLYQDVVVALVPDRRINNGGWLTVDELKPLGWPSHSAFEWVGHSSLEASCSSLPDY